MLSISYIVKNEEHNIVKSLNSVKDIASEIVIVDTGSTDNTVSVINKWYDDLGIINKPVLKLLFKEWTNFADCRNYGIEQCTSPFIFILDADETVRNPEAIKKLIYYPDVDVWSVVQLDKSGQMCYTFRLIKSDCRYKAQKPEDIIHENIDTTGKEVRYSDLIIDHNKDITPEEHKAKIENIMSVFSEIPEGLKKDYYEGVYELWSGSHKTGFAKLNNCIGKVSTQLQAFIYLMVGHYYSVISEVYKAETLHFYNKSLEIAPEQNEGYIKTAQFYFQNGDKENALKCLHKVRDRKNRLMTQMQNDMYYTNEQIDLRIKQIGA